jgi:hypothetical protein
VRCVPFIAVLVPAVALACGAMPREAAIRFRHAERCHDLQFRVSTTGAARLSLHEVVVAVNGEVCHREGVPGSTRVYGELAAVCPGALLDEDAANLVEVLIVPPGCARRPIAQRTVICAGEPE